MRWRMDDENSDRSNKQSGPCEKIEIIKSEWNQRSNFTFFSCVRSLPPIALVSAIHGAMQWGSEFTLSLLFGLTMSPLVCSNKFSLEIENDTKWFFSF